MLLSAHIERFIVSIMQDFLLDISSLKGWVYMITILTYIAHIDIGEYKHSFKYLETTPSLHFFGFFLNPENRREIEKNMPDNPKKDA